jgi:hypothetical protein
MSQDFLDQVKRKMIGTSPNWIKPFKVDDYVSNPPLIEKLYSDRALTSEPDAVEAALKDAQVFFAIVIPFEM